MNELGISLVWLVGQVTLLCLVTAAIYFVARRRHPVAGATAALTGVLLSVVLALGLLSPWPRWSLREASPGSGESAVVSAMDEPAERSPAADVEQVDEVSASSLASDQPSGVELESRSIAAWNAFWKGLGTELSQPQPSRRETGIRWSGWLAVALLIAMALGAARLLVGWIGVRRCVRRSAVIRDRSLSEMLDVLRAELGCRRAVELRESSDVASAATVGWRRPLILLPRGWREWSDRECRAVLAHELAHVTAGDAATWLAAQVGLLLHFYHPLVHWLTHRLRLEQELAADALAARLSGSPQSYLTTLAELAVRQPDHPTHDWIGAWPARAFLPTRGTLLRRIEMLRDTKTPPLRSSTLRRATVIGLTVAAALFVAGLRPPEAQQALAQKDSATNGRSYDIVQVQDGEQAAPISRIGGDFIIPQGATDDRANSQGEKFLRLHTSAAKLSALLGVDDDRTKPQAEEEGGFNLEYVPGTTKLMVGIRPALFHQRPELHPLFEMYEEATEADKTGIHLKDIDQMLFVIHRGPVSFEAGEELFRGSVIQLRMKQPTDFTQYAKTVGFWTIDDTIDHAVTNDPPHILTEEERSKLRATEAIVQAHWKKLQELGDEGGSYQPDERTIIWGMGDDVASIFVDQFRTDAEPPDWKERFESADDSDLCVIWDTAAFRPLIQQMFNEQPNPFVGMFAPLWQKTNLVIGGANVEDRLTLTVNGWTADADDAAKLEKTLTSLVPFATGLLETAKASAKQEPPEMQAALQPSFALAGQALENIQVETTDDHVTVTVEADAGSVATLAAAMLPAIQQAREAARRTQTRNNLKQIGLAFHNFHDVKYGDKPNHFPPPVLYGKSGSGRSKHPHSWRVAILPFIDQSDLYEQYRFDEPWDSEQNRKVLEQMPAIFRSPNDDPDSTNTAYYVLVGEDTAVGAKPEPDGQPTKGVSMRDITDGLSNTIMVVEAKRDIPWTKPEDIPYSPDEDLPKLGGWHAHGFDALFADGSVKFIAEAIDAALLRALITRNGGEVIDLNEF